MFAKVFTQILDSSIAEDYRIRLVFEDMLKLADKNGIVDMTPASIARRTNVPIGLVKKGIASLESPDPTSRSQEEDGRRIVRLDEHRDWGWRIVNFLKYRDSATKEMLRMGEAERKREQRKRFPHTPSKKNQSTEAEADMSHLRPDMSRTTPLAEVPTEKEFLAECNRFLVPDWYALDKFLAKDQWRGDWRKYARRVKGWYENDGRPAHPGERKRPKVRASV